MPLNTSYFIANRISRKSSRSFSKLIIRIAIAGIMLSLAAMILSVAVIKGFKTEIKEKVRGYLGDVRIYSHNMNNSFESSPFVPDNKTLALINNHPNVEWYQNFATKPAIISVNGEVEGINFKGIDSTFHWNFIQKSLVEGNIIKLNSKNSSREILLSQSTANRLKVKVGDEFVMHFVQNLPRPRKFKVVGIYDIGIEAIDKGFAIGSIDVIRRINNWGAQTIGGVEIKLKKFDSLNATTGELHQVLNADLQAESIDNYFPSIFSWLDMLDVNTEVLLFLMLLVGVINMITALLIMILERVNMIGILKSFGATNYTIVKIFLYNAFYLILVGLLLGNLLGLGLGYLQLEFKLFKLQQSSYFLKYVPIEFHWQDVVLLNLGTIIICMLVLLIPSLLVSKITALKAIRFK